MSELSKRLLEQMSKMSLEGHFGAETAKSAVAYHDLDDPITACVKFVGDYYSLQVPSEEECGFRRSRPGIPRGSRPPIPR